MASRVIARYSPERETARLGQRRIVQWRHDPRRVVHQSARRLDVEVVP